MTPEDSRDDYSDIINLPHHTSERRPRMSMAARAAQFSSFAAVKGHEEEIEETAAGHATRYETQTIDTDDAGL